MVISNKLSNSISSDLSERGLIKEEYRDSYAYCLEFLFDMILFNASLILIGCLMHRTLLSVIFVLTLTPIKMVAGGTHAGSRLSCEILSYAVFIAVILLPSLISLNTLAEFFISLAVSIAVIVFTPVEVSGRSAVIANRKRLRVLCIIFCTAALIAEAMLLLNRYADCADIIFLCLAVIFINQLIGLLIVCLSATRSHTEAR